MAKKLHVYLAAALLCGTAGLAGPASAATHHKVTHHAVTTKHKAARTSNEARLNAREHDITARLNRQALMGEQHAEATTPISNTSSTEDEPMQQAFLEDDE
jgi:hypothetical protein